MIPVDARRLCLYIRGSDRWEGRPLYRAVVEVARASHVAGASVFLVDRAYGSRGRLHDARSEYGSADVPVVVEFVDGPEAIEALLQRLRPMVADGFATVEPVRVVRYAHHRGDPPAATP